MDNISIEEKVNLIKMMYTGKGRFCKFTDKVYGFIHNDNTVNIIDTYNMLIFDKAYQIKYITDDIILLSNFSIVEKIYNCLILDANIFKIIQSKGSSFMDICGDIIYEIDPTEFTISSLRVYDLKGNYLNSLEFDGTDISITNMELTHINNSNYYMIGNSSLKYITYYDKGKSIKIVSKVGEHHIDNIGDGLYMFSPKIDTDKVIVYDFIKNKIVNE